MTDEFPSTYDPVGESSTSTHRYVSLVLEETIEETKQVTVYPPGYFSDENDGL